MKHAAALLLSVVLGPGCKSDKPESAAASSAGSSEPKVAASAPKADTSAPGAPGVVTGTISTDAPAPGVPVASVVKGGGRVGKATSTLSHGRAKWTKEGGLEILLREKPVTCGPLQEQEGGDDLRFLVPAGPYGRFFEGQTVGVPGSLSAEKTFAPFYAHSAMVTLDRVTTTSGGHVVGSILVRGMPLSGDAALDVTASFDIPICPGAPAKPTQAYVDPAPPPTQELKAAFAWIERGGIAEIRLFYDGTATCASRHKANARNFYMLVEFGRDRLGDKQASGLQPAVVWYHPPAPEEFATGGSAFPQGPAVIEWESYETRPGAKLRGRVWATGSSPPVEGPFVATVCP